MRDAQIGHNERCRWGESVRMLALCAGRQLWANADFFIFDPKFNKHLGLTADRLNTGAECAAC